MKIIVNIHLLNKKENPYNQAVKREMSIAVKLLSLSKNAEKRKCVDK